MEKWFSLYPSSILEFTSEKDLKTIYDQFYQQMILTDSETRIAFISKDDIKKEYQFEVDREHIIFRSNMGGTMIAKLTGWGILTQKDGRVQGQIFLKNKSWSFTAFLSLLFICILAEIYRSVLLNQFKLSIFLFIILLGVIGYLYVSSAMKRQIRIVKGEIAKAVK